MRTRRPVSAEIVGRSRGIQWGSAGPMLMYKSLSTVCELARECVVFGLRDP